MEKFYRQDNLKIVFGPKPGKGPCLEFRSADPVEKPELLGNQREVLKDIIDRAIEQAFQKGSQARAEIIREALGLGDLL